MMLIGRGTEGVQFDPGPIETWAMKAARRGDL